MGKTKGKHLRTAAEELVKKFPGAFTGDFDADQTTVRKMGVIRSGSELNKLSAQVATLTKRIKIKAAKLEKANAPAVAVAA